jgi:hypothetical protein
MSDNFSSSEIGKWTIMIYLAGDNNLDTYALKDLSELCRVGSTSDVAVVAQLDRMADQISRRYFITSTENLDTSCVAELDEINTGDPTALLDFITWASQTYPAERYGLVLWNHGSGWKDEDIYKIAQRKQVAEKVTRGQIRGLTTGKISRALFSSSLENLVTDYVGGERAILFDDSSADFLDNIELRSVLQQTVEHIGHPLDLIGFDACLMNMIEVGYQIRDLCHVMVGSQEVEPGDGWPYDAVLAELTKDPVMTPEDLGIEIVEEYINFYRTHFPNLSVTQSAILLNRLDNMIELLDNLAHLLKNSLPSREALGLVFTSLRSAQRFSDHDYVDLTHFCQMLASYDERGKIGQAAQLVTDALTDITSPVIAEGHHGSNVTNSHGMSIYLPARSLSSLYHRLEFSQQHAWDEFLTAFTLPS